MIQEIITSGITGIVFAKLGVAPAVIAALIAMVAFRLTDAPPNPPPANP